MAFTYHCILLASFPNFKSYTDMFIGPQQVVDSTTGFLNSLLDLSNDMHPTLLAGYAF